MMKNASLKKKPNDIITVSNLVKKFGDFTAVDDISGVVMGHTMDQLRTEGALDAYVTAIQMKKNRPGFEVHVLCQPQQMNSLCGILFKETGTLGIRVYPVQRLTLQRSLTKIKKNGFEIKIKIVKGVGGHHQHRPEYESLKEIASHTRLPLKHTHSVMA